MKSLYIVALVFSSLFGRSNKLPEMLPADHFMPALAAATILIDRNATPATPVTPSGQCLNCNGTGKIPLRPDLPDDPSKQTCPVCGGSGKTASMMLENPVGPTPQSEATESVKTVSSGQVPGIQSTDRGGLKQTAVADDYTEIEYIPVEEALAEAEQTGKPIWIHVTDLKSCRECIRLEREVLNQVPVIKASRGFVCVRLDWNHPWRLGLIGNSAVPIDCFGTVDEWKSLKRFQCAKTVPGYVNQLIKVQGK